jgi:hypothetical protein
MPFEDYSELVGAPITLPIAGKKYVLPPVSAEAGVELLDVLRNPDGEAAKARDETGLRSIKMLLGDELVEKMLKDGVPYEAILRASVVQMADFLYGRQEAEDVWKQSAMHVQVQRASDPEATAPARGRSRSATARTRTSSTGAVRTTRSRASGTNTTSRPRGR